MSDIRWNKNYSVGVKELDQQHRRLLEIINDLADAKDRRKEDDSFFSTLNGLIKYAEGHFRTEERYMKDYGYPGLAVQEKAHIDFTEKTFALHARFSEKDPHTYYEIMDFMKSWYISHVLGIDQKYKGFFAQKGVK